MTEEQISSIALSLCTRPGLRQKCDLVKECGTATEACRQLCHHASRQASQHQQMREAVSDMSSHMASDISSQMSSLMARAEEEMAWVEKNNIRCICFTDDDYPVRLKQCADAPLVLFALGKVNLNPTRVLAVVGTRHITEYGRKMCDTFIRELSQKSPDTLIVSGLAYGVDIHAHRAALQDGLPTVGILAHGLDQVYPTKHRQTAIDMIHQGGGLVTEFVSGTHIEKSRFVQRNRIVAGMADATLIVQGAEKSGSMVTARLTHDYDRELFCCPGRVDDELSSGCNRLIQRQMAHMTLSVDDVLETMNWPNELLRQQTLQEGVQQELFPNLTADEERIVASLRDTDGLHLNDICERCALSVGDVSSLLFTLELKGLIRQGAGGRYSL